MTPSKRAIEPKTSCSVGVSAKGECAKRCICTDPEFDPKDRLLGGRGERNANAGVQFPLPKSEMTSGAVEK